MKVISFDVGIKNMAYCIFDIKENLPLKIIDWKTVNLMNEEDSIKPEAIICSCSNKPKKGIFTKCSRHALYMKTVNLTQNTNTLFFCDKHAKETAEYIIPDKSQLQSSLNKLNVEQLNELCQIHAITPSIEDKLKRKKLVNILVNFFKEKCFEQVKHKKQKTSKETDLISIGHNMRRELNKIQNFESITHVIIENQISTLAARMNSIQGMLVQYFIMKMEDKIINIEFISSSNKLKGLPLIKEDIKKQVILKKIKKISINSENGFLNTCDSVNPSEKSSDYVFTEKPTINSKYKDHKRDGLYHCALFLEHNPELTQWKHVLDTKKKDDYADCFLQGVWYIKNHGMFKNNTNYNLY